MQAEPGRAERRQAVAQENRRKKHEAEDIAEEGDFQWIDVMGDMPDRRMHEDEDKRRAEHPEDAAKITGLYVILWGGGHAPRSIRNRVGSHDCR